MTDRLDSLSDADLAERPWERLARRTVHATPYLRLHEDRVRMPDGRESLYGVVECGHCVGVLPFVAPDRVVLVRQFRYVAGRPTWEMPTGGVHSGEGVLAAAHRELVEESGFRAEKLIPVCTYHTSKSSIDETAHLFLGYDLRPASAPPDDTEFIRREVHAFDRVLEMVLSGEITDSMTIIAVLHAERLARGAVVSGPGRRR